MRIADRAKRGLVGRRAERKLVQVGLADDDGAGRPKPGDDRGVGVRDVRRPNARRRRRRCPFQIEEILEGYWDAMQRSAVAPGGNLAIGLARLSDFLFVVLAVVFIVLCFSFWFFCESPLGERLG